MLYCPRCQILCKKGESRCPSCGSKKLRPVQPTDPILLLTASKQECARITTAFQDAEIPCTVRWPGSGGLMNLLGGTNRTADGRIFVPFSAISQCRRILQSIGALKAEDEKDSLSGRTGGSNGKEEPPVPMSRGKRTAVRIFSVILFIFLVWAVVNLADDLTDCIRNMLQITY